MLGHILREFKDWKKWKKREFRAPSPDFVKKHVIKRQSIPGGTFVETGTYYGTTTKLACDFSSKVVTLEPEPKLFAYNQDQFAQNSKVTVLNGTSEDLFPSLLPTLKGDVTFWLDGHFSAGPTFKGQQDTPILDELASIEKNLKLYKKVVVLVDDLRCFENNTGEYSQYPSITVLTDWASKHKFTWHIEHDILCMRNF